MARCADPAHRSSPSDGGKNSLCVGGGNSVTASQLFGREDVSNDPAGVRGKVFLEVADAAEIQTFTTAAQVEIEWFFRGDYPPGTTTLLMNAIREADFPDKDERLYLWAGCEFNTFRAIRAFARQERQLANNQHLVVSYWRRGATEEE